MAIEFKLPETIEKQLRGVQLVAENVMRPEITFALADSPPGRLTATTPTRLTERLALTTIPSRHTTPLDGIRRRA